MPQQLANLLLPASRPEIQPSTRETKSVEPRAGSKSESFSRTLDRQLDRQQPAKQTEQAQPKETLSDTREAPASKESGDSEEAVNLEDVASSDTDSTVETSSQPAISEEETSGEGFAANPALVTIPKITSFKAADNTLTAIKTPQQNGTPGNGTPGNTPVDEILPDAAAKDIAAGKTTDQKPIVLAQTSEIFTKELAAINAQSGSKIISDEATAQLAKQSDETKTDKNSNGLLQKALSEVSGLQNGLTKAAPNATAFANANGNANFLAPTLPGGTPTEISQSLEELGIMPQNAHTVSTKFGTAIQSNQSAQTAINSLAVQIAKQVDLGVNRFQIRMDPPELGRIDVKLEFGKDGRMTAHLTVERAETLDLLQRDARALERALAGSGLNTDKDSLNFSLKDQSANEYADFKQDAETGSDRPGTGEEEADIPPDLSRTLAAYQNLISTTAVDIRI